MATRTVADERTESKRELEATKEELDAVMERYAAAELAAAAGDGPESHPALLDRRIRRTALASARRGVEAAYAGDRSDGGAANAPGCPGCGEPMRYVRREDAPVESAPGRVEVSMARYSCDACGTGRGPGQVRGLTWEEVELMCGLAQGDGLRGKRDAAILGVAADGLMRVSEVSGLNAEDVSFLPNGTAEVLVRRSKTDQHGRGEVSHLGAVATERLRAWMADADVDRGPLFRPVDRWGRVSDRRLGPDSVRAAIKRRAREAGIQGRVSGHSLRIGTAQRLAEEGTSLVEIQKEGRWKSCDMPAYYVRGQVAARGAVARHRAAEQEAKKGEKAVAPPETAVVEFG